VAVGEEMNPHTLTEIKDYCIDSKVKEIKHDGELNRPNNSGLFLFSYHLHTPSNSVVVVV